MIKITTLKKRNLFSKIKGIFLKIQVCKLKFITKKFITLNKFQDSQKFT